MASTGATVARASRLESRAARPSAVIAAHGTMSYEH
jgi:class 3 adenylate cyclase